MRSLFMREMTKSEGRSSNDERKWARSAFRHSSLAIPSSFLIRHSSLIQISQRDRDHFLRARQAGEDFAHAILAQGAHARVRGRAGAAPSSRRGRSPCGALRRRSRRFRKCPSVPCSRSGGNARSRPARMTCASPSCEASMRRARSSDSERWPGSLQLVQSRLTSRWAMIARIEVATRNGCTPMSIETRDGGRGVVRVQGAEDEVAGEAGVGRDRGGLEIANFTDHDDVRAPGAEWNAAPRERSCRSRCSPAPG